MVTVRLFAAAAEAAGVNQTTVPAGTTDDVSRALTASFGDDFGRVLSQCALLVDGRRVSSGDAVSSGSTLDVLPPFAGG
jgi:molybdopterin synthase sulfur carrier subunit